jgi:hypothetical protein
MLVNRYDDCVEILLKYGAKIDVETRMCWPGPHNQNCEERGKYCVQDESMADRSSDKLQGSLFYAIDGDQVSTYILYSIINALHRWQ